VIGGPGRPADMSPIVRLAPAKLNLTLAVAGRRADGYHELHSVMVPLALADAVSVAPTIGLSDTLKVDGADCGPAESNLVLRAVAEAREAARNELGPTIPVPPLACRLEKRIPVAAGLAGGSSDGAAALDAALEAWGADVSPEGRHAAATRIGSDVPFFLAAGWALVEGRGERVSRIPSVRPPAPAVLLVTPMTPVPTPGVFAAYADGVRPLSRGSGLLASRHLADELRAGMTARALLMRAGLLAHANDLMPAAQHVVPGLVAFRRGLIRVLGTAVGQSGSGPTAWVLYPSLDEAEAAADAVRDALADGRVVAPGQGSPVVHATRLLLDPSAGSAGTGEGGFTR
jgi:4-diphosphocytidyl-2-C-methyl-D-erythritol kinase